MACSMGYIVDSALKSQASYYLDLSFLPSVPSLDEDLAQNDDWGLLLFSQISSFLSYDHVFCIHKILGQMDEFDHGLRLFFIEFMYE